MRLKLKANRRRLQREPKHHVDKKLLGKKEVEGFRRVLEEELGSDPTGSVEEV